MQGDITVLPWAQDAGPRIAAIRAHSNLFKGGARDEKANQNCECWSAYSGACRGILMLSPCGVYGFPSTNRLAAMHDGVSGNFGSFVL